MRSYGILRPYGAIHSCGLFLLAYSAGWAALAGSSRDSSVVERGPYKPRGEGSSPSPACMVDELDNAIRDTE